MDNSDFDAFCGKDFFSVVNLLNRETCKTCGNNSVTAQWSIRSNTALWSGEIRGSHHLLFAEGDETLLVPYARCASSEETAQLILQRAQQGEFDLPAVRV